MSRVVKTTNKLKMALK